MFIKAGKEREQILQENVTSGTVHKAETCHYLGITINEEGDLEKHMKVIAKKM